MPENKKSKTKLILTLCAVLAVLIAVPFVGTAADDVAPLTEISPAAGEAEEAPTPPSPNSKESAAAEGDAQEEPKVDYNTVLSFPITEEKVRAFVLAGHKIDQVNRKWDMLISAAGTDTMAVELMKLSAEEMQEVMTSITDITVAEYNEIFEYTTKDRDFKKIVAAFKQHYVDVPEDTKN